MSEAVEACPKEKHQAGDLKRGMVVVALARLSADRCVTLWVRCPVLGDLGAFGFMDWLKDSKTETLETGMEMIQ